MKTGTLWFDNSKERDLPGKLERAAEYYLRKHGKYPTTCYVHPSTLLGSPGQVAGMRLLPSNTVLPHHFWLGHEDATQEQRPAA